MFRRYVPYLTMHHSASEGLPTKDKLYDHLVFSCMNDIVFRL